MLGSSNTIWGAVLRAPNFEEPPCTNSAVRKLTRFGELPWRAGRAYAPVTCGIPGGNSGVASELDGLPGPQLHCLRSVLL